MARGNEPGIVARLALGFAVAAVSVLVFHQGIWEILHVLRMMPPPFPLAPVPPFGVPQVYDFCFWRGLSPAASGLITPWLPARCESAQVSVLGLIAEAGALFLVPALRGWPLAFGGAMRPILISTLINATWGLGVGWFTPLVLARRR